MQGVNSKSLIAVRLDGRWFRAVCASVVFAASLASVAQDGHPPQASPALAQDASAKPAPAKPAEAQQANPATTDRKRQIADESTELLNMALALKAEVDKTTKDTLSLNVIKKADQIEKLAKSVKEKMKQSSGS